MSLKRLPKAKGLSRIDDPGGHGVGWYARVRFRGKTYSRYFADASHKGTRSAYAKAIAWRNAKEREIGKPRTDRIVPAGRRGKPRLVGVYIAKQSFVVAWSPAPGVVKREFVSIRKYGRAEAFRRAVELRRKRERSIYGGALADASTRRYPRSRGAGSSR